MNRQLSHRLRAFLPVAAVFTFLWAVYPLFSRGGNDDPMIFGFQFSAEKESLVVISVISGSPADEAGLQAGDRIVGINDGPLPEKLLKEPRETLAEIQEASFLVDTGEKTVTISMKKKRLSQIAPGGNIRYAQDPLQMAGYRKGDVVADMEYISRNGEKVTSLYAIKAKYKLISFWATWCKACRQKIPAYTWARKRFSEKELAIISVSLDEDRSKEVQFTIENDMNWYHYREPGDEGNLEFNSQWKVYSIPVAVLLDQNHKIIEIITSQKNLAETLEQNL